MAEENIKKIALLINSANYEHQKKTIHALRYALRQKGGFALYVFTSYGLRLGWADSTDADYSIYDLIDYADFDGYIIEGNFGNNFELLYKVTETIKKTGKPVVSLNAKLEGIPCVLYDSYAATTEVIEHLINVHNCKKINFSMNVIHEETDRDELMALQAYRETLEKHNIEYDRRRVINTTVSIKNGRSHYFMMKNAGIDDAEATVFTHDVKAIGYCMEFEEHGFDVPKDMIICSTRRSTNSVVFRPDISGTDPNQIGATDKVVEILTDIMDGKEVPAATFFQGKAVYGRSCGCCKQEPFDRPDDFRQLILSKVEAGNQVSRMMQYNAKFENVTSFKELSNNIQKMLTGISCDQFLVCINKKDISPLDPETENPNDCSFDETMCAFSGCFIGGNIDYLSEFSKSELIPLKPDDGDIAIFLPIIYKNHVYGYTAFLNEYMPIDQYNYRICHEAIGSSIEALRNNLYSMKLRMTDPLTGLSNQYALQDYKRAHSDAKNYSLILFDMDGLKNINDTYGHAIGNVAICTIADALLSMRFVHAIRYGGDEFIVLSEKIDSYYLERDILEVRERINEAAKKQLLPFEIGLSAGYSISTSADPLTLDKAIELADAAMYEDKKHRKGLD